MTFVDLPKTSGQTLLKESDRVVTFYRKNMWGESGSQSDLKVLSGALRDHLFVKVRKTPFGNFWIKLL